MISERDARIIASDWHVGGSPLYQFSSAGIINLEKLVPEIDECIRGEEMTLEQLKSLKEFVLAKGDSNDSTPFPY